VAASVLESLTRRAALPALPTSVASILDALDDERSDAARIADLLVSDVGVAGRVLAMANSAAFNPTGHPFGTMSEAIARLGFRRIRDLVVTTAVVGLFGDQACPFDYAGYWRHCVTTGIAAGALARRAPEARGLRPGENPYFVAGLLHDVGILVLVRCVGRRYTRVLKEAEEKRLPLYQLERERLQLDHGEVGAEVLASWGLPEECIVAARYHHAPAGAPERHREHADLVHLADWIADHEGLGATMEGSLEPFHHGSWDALGMCVDDIPRVIDEFRAAAQRSESLLAAARAGRAGGAA